MKATVVVIATLAVLSSAVAAVLRTMPPEPVIITLATEPLVTAEERVPRFPNSTTTTGVFNLAAMNARVIVLDGEYFMLTSKACRPGYCIWAGRSLGEGTMHLTVANDGQEGSALIRFATGRGATLELRPGKVWVGRHPTPVGICGTGLEEANDAMGMRALRRMARSGGWPTPAR